MKITTINLENWKKFRNPVEVTLKDGLNVLYGPNESGKTTLVDSIITTFYTKHTSNSQKIKSLKPWGSSLHPKSSITFTKNNTDYRIRKGFQNKLSILEKFENQDWLKIAEGDKADKELIRIIGGQIPQRGDTKPEYWGLGQTLWMVQGKPFIKESINDETRSSMQKMVGATIESETEKKVLEEISIKFMENFSPVKKELKKNSQLANIKEKIDNITQDLRDSELTVQKKQTLIRTLEDNKILFEKNQKALEIASNQKAQMALRVNEAREHQRNRELLENEIKDLKTTFTSLNQRLDEIKKLESEIDIISKSNDEINLQLDPLSTESDKLSAKMDDDFRAIENLDQKLNNHFEEKRIAGIAHTAVMDEKALDGKKSLLKEIKKLETDLDLTKNKFNSILVPEKDKFALMESLSQDIHDTQTSLKAMGLTIEAFTRDVMSGEITVDNKTSKFQMQQESQEWTAHQSVKISIDGVGEFNITSGSHDVQEMKEKLEKYKSQFQSLIESYPTSDLSQLKVLMKEKDSLKSDIKWLKSQLEKMSENGEDVLLLEIQSLENRIKSNWDKIPRDSAYKKCEGKDKLKVREELSFKINLMEDVISKLQKDRQKLNEILENDRNTIQSTGKLMVDLKTELHGNNQRKIEIEKRLSVLSGEGKSQEEMDYELTQISVKLEQKERAWKVYNEEIESREIEPLNAFDGLKNKVESLDEEIRRQEINQAGMERELSILMAQSTDSSILQERLAHLKSREKELEVDNQAIKLLYNLSTFYRDNTISKISKPLEQKVSEDLERLLGPKYSLRFDSKMKPDVVDTGSEKTSMDILSFGTQEQIWCVFRLALGSILSEDESQLVVLDDPLVNTDPVRMYHALDILKEKAEEMQIVVVTCDLDKYRSLSDANFISCENLSE